MANIAQPDLSVFNRIKTVSDFDRLNQEFELKKQLASAKLAKAGSLNVKSLGEQGFVKAAMGLPLTPEEHAAATFLDAKSGGLQFDPVTGSQIQKDRLTDRIPLGGTQQTFSQQPAPPTQDFTQQPMPTPQPKTPTQADADVRTLFDNYSTEPNPPLEQVNEFDVNFQRELDAAVGNPKLQQQIRAAYAKSKLQMTDAESKNAGFADRMSESNPIIDARTEAGLNPINKIASHIPLIGNIVAGSDFRSFNQAQRDFINAQLRRESGAVINPDEFANAAQQYFPQIGDDPNTLAQKKANRDAVVNAMKRSAGPAYKAPDIKVINKGNTLDVEFKLRKAGYTPEEIQEYKRAKGL